MNEEPPTPNEIKRREITRTKALSELYQGGAEPFIDSTGTMQPSVGETQQESIREEMDAELALRDERKQAATEIASLRILLAAAYETGQVPPSITSSDSGNEPAKPEPSDTQEISHERLEDREQKDRTFELLAQLGDALSTVLRQSLATWGDEDLTANLGFFANDSLSKLNMAVYEDNTPLHNAMLVNLKAIIDICGAAEVMGHKKALRLIAELAPDIGTYSIEEDVQAAKNLDQELFNRLLERLSAQFRDTVTKPRLSAYYWNVNETGQVLVARDR